MPDSLHPIVPDKPCAKCHQQPVTVATTTKYVTYYRCEACRHLWSEPHPEDFRPPDDTWAPLPDTDS